MNAAKLIIEVQAGLAPGQPIVEYTRRWTWAVSDQERLVANDPEARALWIRIHGQSLAYAATLEDPQRINWVRRDWVWL